MERMSVRGEKMLKKLSLIAVIVTVLLVGCENENQLEIQLIDLTQELELTELSYMTSIWNGERFKLIDLFASDLVNEFLLEDEALTIIERYDLEGGYKGLLAISGFENGTLAINHDNLEEFRLVLYLFDEQLHLVEIVEISDKQMIMNRNSIAVSYENEELILYYAGFFSGRIYAYHTTLQETTFIFELEDEALVLSELYSTPMNQIAFKAYHIDVEVMTYYGFLDLETLEVELFDIADFQVFQMDIYGNHLLLTENQAMSSQNKIITVNLLTGENRYHQLEENDSQNAQLIANDRLIVTTHYEWELEEYIRIRVYDFMSEEILFEHRILIDELNLETNKLVNYIGVININNDMYALAIGVGGGDLQLGLLAYEFLFFKVNEIQY